VPAVRAIQWPSRLRREFGREVEGTKLDGEFAELLGRIARGEGLPARYRDHPLSGRRAGCRDFHLRPDLVVLYGRSDTVMFFAADWQP